MTSRLYLILVMPFVTTVNVLCKTRRLYELSIIFFMLSFDIIKDDLCLYEPQTQGASVRDVWALKFICHVTTNSRPLDCFRCSGLRVPEQKKPSKYVRKNTRILCYASYSIHILAVDGPIARLSASGQCSAASVPAARLADVLKCKIELALPGHRNLYFRYWVARSFRACERRNI